MSLSPSQVHHENASDSCSPGDARRFRLPSYDSFLPYLAVFGTCFTFAYPARFDDALTLLTNLRRGLLA